MEKYTFSTDFKTVSENLGIADERQKLFFEIAKEYAMRAFFTDSTMTDKSQAMEMFLNTVQPANKVEAFWAGCVFVDVFSQAEKMAENLAKIMSKVSE